MNRPVDIRLIDLVPDLDRTCDDLTAGALDHRSLPTEWWRRLRLPLALGRVGVDHVAAGLAELALARWAGRALGEVMPALYVSGVGGDEEGASGHRFLATPLTALTADVGDGPARDLIRDAFHSVLDRIPQEQRPVEETREHRVSDLAEAPGQGREARPGPDLFREAVPVTPDVPTDIPITVPSPDSPDTPVTATTPSTPGAPVTPDPLTRPADIGHTDTDHERSGHPLLQEVDSWFSQGDERYRAVSCRRVFTDSPETLDAIGSDFGVTRERIRQIHKQVEQDLRTWSESPFGERLGEHVASVAIELGSAAPLDAFWSLRTEHTLTVPSLGIPLGRVVLALLPEHHTNGDWLLTGHVHGLAERLTDLLESKTALPLTEALELTHESGVLPRHARAWLESQPHAHVVADRIVHWGRSLPDKAYAVLSALERPLHVDELVAHLGGDFNEAGFRDRIHNDDRLMRRDRRVFGLRAWGGEEYLGVEGTMRRELERVGGEMRVTELAELVSGRFDVTEGSVRALAAGSEFDRPRPGWVAILDGPEPAINTSYRPRRGVERTRRCFRDDEGTWWLRLDLNAEHLRGSGFPVPSGFAAGVGMYPGVRMPVRIDGREAAVTWKNQPLMSSVRALLLRENAVEGDHAFLTITHGEVRCRVLTAPEPGPDPMDRALRLAGIAHLTPNPLSALASTVGLSPEATRAQILEHLTDRGDHDILAALEADQG